MKPATDKADAELEEPEDLNDQEAAKVLRCEQFDYDEEDKPRCYSENTSKEELVLEHVLEYKR